MNALTLEMFVGAQHDFELSQFHILNGLQQVRKQFAQNKIYPTLAELIELYTSLNRVSQSGRNLRAELPKRIKRIDLKNNRIIYEPVDLHHADIEAIEQLIEWAMPFIRQAIEEGQTIFNFVDDNIKVEEVGILPTYVEEGYFLLPDLQGGLVHVIRYEVSIFSSSEQRYRNLKTTTIKTIPLASLGFSPGSVKMELITTHRELPNPATYYFATDLDFPFLETMLPIAKRKLLRKVSS